MANAPSLDRFQAQAKREMSVKFPRRGGYNRTSVLIHMAVTLESKQLIDAGIIVPGKQGNFMPPKAD